MPEITLSSFPTDCWIAQKDIYTDKCVLEMREYTETNDCTIKYYIADNCYKFGAEIINTARPKFCNKKLGLMQDASHLAIVSIDAQNHTYCEFMMHNISVVDIRKIRAQITKRLVKV